MIYTAQQARALANYPEIQDVLAQVNGAIERGQLSVRFSIGLAPGVALRLKNGLESLGYVVTNHGSEQVTKGELTWTEYDVEISWDI